MRARDVSFLQMAQLRVIVIGLLFAAGCREPPGPSAIDECEACFFPAPRHLERLVAARVGPRSACVDTAALASHARLDALVPELLRARGLTLDPGACEWPLTFVAQSGALGSLSSQAQAALAQAGDRPERYAVVTSVVAGHAATQLFAASEAGARHALTIALALPEPSTVVDWPGFATRGVVEGFYGVPFSPGDRRETLRKMEQLRQNTYLYGPKDDPFARERWAEPYPSQEAQEIADAAAEAEAHLVNFVWSISPALGVGVAAPGASIHYASDADFQRLVAKIESVRALGVTRFALFLDDVQPMLVWDDDRAAFASLAEAHASLMNRLQVYLLTRDPSARLLTVGQAYTSIVDGWQAYNDVLGAALRPDIEVLWTGPRTFSDTIVASDLDAIDGKLARQVTIWDNWPIVVEPLTGRSADLPTRTRGILSNAILSEEGHPTRDTWTVLGPIADYTWNPDAYDASRSGARWAALLSR